MSTLASVTTSASVPRFSSPLAGLCYPSLRPLWSQRPAMHGYAISPTRTAHQQGLANMLVQQMDHRRGHPAESAGQRWNTPNWLTIAAWQFGEVVATLTLCRDSPEGLPADAFYAPELSCLRRRSQMLCEVTRLAVDPDFSCRDLLLALFRAAQRYARECFAASDAVFAVNAHYVRYYQRLLGFRPLRPLRPLRSLGYLHASANGSAVLMYRPLES